MIKSGRPTLRALIAVAVLASAFGGPPGRADATITSAATGTTSAARSAPEPPEPEGPVEADDEVLDLLTVTPSPTLNRAKEAWNQAQEAEQDAVDAWVAAEQTRLDLWGLKTVADVTVADARTQLAADQKVVDQETATLYRLRAKEQDRLDVLDAHRVELRRMAAAAFAASSHDDPIGLGTFDEMSRGNRRDAALTTVIEERSDRVKAAHKLWATAKDAGDDQQRVLTKSEAVRDEQAEMLALFVQVRDGYVRLHDEAEVTVGERTDDLDAARKDTLESRDDHRAARLTSTVPALGFPLVAADAYWRASGNAPCHIPWWLVAGVGRIESGHGTAHGSRLTETGDTTVRILGIALNGTRNTAAIRDTDGGRLDGDATWDRAVGPMQFIPGTWGRWAADGNEDGESNPHNLYDASAAAAAYLCNVQGDVNTDVEARIALMAYNRSSPYGLLVVDQGHRYRASVDLPDIRPPDPEPVLESTTPG
ncbi:MAG: lytic murein transglycosylase [Aquihabitans sp.]